MKKVILYVLLVSFTLSSTLYAQHTSGIVNYRGVINKKHVDSFLTDLNSKKDVPMHIKQGVAKMYNNATPDDYVLNFKNEESYYYHIPALEEEAYNVGSKAGTVPYYTNSATDTIIEMSPTLGNIVHEPLEWEITNKKKTIGAYTCYQAIAREEFMSRKGDYYHTKVIVWFAPEIPLNFGPKNYVGLPGLVLEVERDSFTITATKINLNPNKEIKIKRVKSNEKMITREESRARIKEIEEDRRKEYGG